jgi:hypothetical protein
MKIKLLFVAALAAVLAAVGSVVLMRATFTQATPSTLPVQPFTVFNANTMESTALGASSASRAVGGTPQGARLNSGTSFNYRFGGAADLDIPNGYEAAWITSDTEVLCDGTVDVLAENVPNKGDPYPAYESTTNVDTDGLLGTDPDDYVRFNSPLWSMVARYVIPMGGIWIGGLDGFFLPFTPPIPVNSIAMQVPWNPLTQASQVTLAGNPAPPTGICTDSPLTTTTDTVATDNPPLQGDSGGPCAGCTDAGITGWWPSPGKATGTVGTPVPFTISERVHNNGPVAGSFEVWWEFEPPANVTGIWTTEVGDSVVGNALTFTGSTGPVGTSTPYTRTLNLTCSAPGSYLVALKNVWYPVSPTKDQTLANNAATTMIQLECGDVSGLTPVDKEVIWVMPKAADQVDIIDGKVDVDENSTVDASDDLADVALSLLAGGRDQVDIIDGQIDVNESGTVDAADDLNDVFLPLVNGDPDVVNIIDGQVDVDQNGSVGAADDLNNVLLNLVRPDAPDHLQLLEGDTATVMVDELKAYHPDEGAALASADGVETLVAETVDQTKIEAKWVSSGSSVLTETVSEPAGEQVRNIENLTVKCLSGSAALSQPQPVVLKAIDRPGTGLRETRPGDNVQRWVINVWCFADSTARNAAKDTVDDGTGLYLRWGTYLSYADIRKSGKAGADVGSPGDTSYQEYMVVPECFWLDADGGAGESLDTDHDGYISAAESHADPDIPGMGYSDIDSDGDCLIDAAYAQPGQPVDSQDEPTGTLCPPLVYSDSGGAIKVQYDMAADQDCDGLTDGVEVGWGSDPTLADTDGDGASDFLEMRYSTDPGNPDTDYDGLKDKPEDDYVAAPAGGFETNGLTGIDLVNEPVNADDNCPNKYNPGQENNDGKPIANGAGIPGTVSSNPNADTMGDACDPDDDNDDIADVAELQYNLFGSCILDPLNPDTDGDHTRDGVEIETGSDPCVNGPTAAALTAGQTILFRGGGINVPANSLFGGLWDGENDMTDDGREKNADADYTGMPHDAAHSYNSFGDGGLDKDNDDGSYGNPAEIADVVEVKGFNTEPSKVDTDGDGCADWIEMVDVNGDRKANILDVLQFAQSCLGGEVTVEPDLTLLDLNKDRTLNILDVQVAAKNSDLVKAHSKCPSDTER